MERLKVSAALQKIRRTLTDACLGLKRLLFPNLKELQRLRRKNEKALKVKQTLKTPKPLKLNLRGSEVKLKPLKPKESRRRPTKTG
jgi:hypothetical protein